jgi:hypothetical protein
VPVELRFLDAPVPELIARITARNAALPPDAPRIDPNLAAYFDTRIQRPDAAELALFDPPATRAEEAGRQS